MTVYYCFFKMTEEVSIHKTENESVNQNEKRSVCLVFQALAHLSSSMASLDRRLRSIEEAAVRTNERTVDILTKVQKNLLHVQIGEKSFQEVD